MWQKKKKKKGGNSVMKKYNIRDSLAVQWLDSTLSTVEGLGSVPGQGTETPQAVQCREKK